MATQKQIARFVQVLSANGFSTPVVAPKGAAITLLAAVNPKKPGSLAHARFALYKTGQSVAAYVESCVVAGQSRRNATADLAWDTKHGFITVA